METQLKYKSDAQVNFEDKILNDDDLFSFYARSYIEDFERESFLEWCWNNKSSVEVWRKYNEQNNSNNPSA